MVDVLSLRVEFRDGRIIQLGSSKKIRRRDGRRVSQRDVEVRSVSVRPRKNRTFRTRANRRETRDAGAATTLVLSRGVELHEAQPCSIATSYGLGRPPEHLHGLDGLSTPNAGGSRCRDPALAPQRVPVRPSLPANRKRRSIAKKGRPSLLGTLALSPRRHELI